VTCTTQQDAAVLEGLEREVLRALRDALVGHEEVELEPAEALEQIDPRRDDEPGAQLRMHREEPAEVPDRASSRDGGSEAHVEGPGEALAEALRLPLEVLERAEHRPGAHEHRLACRGRHDALWEPVEAAQPEQPLDLLDAPGEGGLRDAERLRRPRHVPMLRDRREVLEVPAVELHARKVSRSVPAAHW
jgi:hypothetical protein